jgi:hypothetical protein
MHRKMSVMYSCSRNAPKNECNVQLQSECTEKWWRHCGSSARQKMAYSVRKWSKGHFCSFKIIHPRHFFGRKISLKSSQTQQSILFQRLFNNMFRPGSQAISRLTKNIKIYTKLWWRLLFRYLTICVLITRNVKYDNFWNKNFII